MTWNSSIPVKGGSELSRLILKHDSARSIILEEPRTAAVALTILSLIAALGLRLFFPKLVIAQGLLGGLGLWHAAKAMKLHRLHLDLAHRSYRYYDGWLFSAPVLTGEFDATTQIAIEPNDSASGLEVSRIRSRLIVLEIAGFEDGGTFVLGFPMGPRIDMERAADYARRLGVGLVDRTDQGEKVQP